jgi:pimeloyl-ACP methyl ester carboxylesterase
MHGVHVRRLTWFAAEGEFIGMPIEKIRREDGAELAYDYLPGTSPVLVFLPGFASDMGGTKAMFLRQVCAERGQAMLRLDYSGHGASGGKFEDGSIGVWTNDAMQIIQAITGAEKLLLAGSSMGGWIALLLARQLASRVESLLLIAPAPDFTELMMRPRLGPAQLAALERHGVFYEPSEYGAPLPITRKLLDHSRDYLLLGGPIAINCPVAILQGMRDPDVPWRHSLKLAECLESKVVELSFVKDGDHRLSRGQDLSLLAAALRRLLGQDGA